MHDRGRRIKDFKVSVGITVVLINELGNPGRGAHVRLGESIV